MYELFCFQYWSVCVNWWERCINNCKNNNLYNDHLQMKHLLHLIRWLFYSFDERFSDGIFPGIIIIAFRKLFRLARNRNQNWNWISNNGNIANKENKGLWSIPFMDFRILRTENIKTSFIIDTWYSSTALEWITSSNNNLF